MISIAEMIKRERNIYRLFMHQAKLIFHHLRLKPPRKIEDILKRIETEPHLIHSNLYDVINSYLLECSRIIYIRYYSEEMTLLIETIQKMSDFIPVEYVKEVYLSELEMYRLKLRIAQTFDEHKDLYLALKKFLRQVEEFGSTLHLKEIMRLRSEYKVQQRKIKKREFKTMNLAKEIKERLDK